MSRTSMRAMLLWLALVPACLGCARCGRAQREPQRPALPAEDLVPRSADVVLGAPSLARFAETLTGLERLSIFNYGARLLLFQNAQELFERLLERVGVDLRAAEAVTAAGLGGEGSVAIFAAGNDGHCLVAPLADAARFDAFVAELAASRFGAEHGSASEEAGATVRTYASAANEAPSVGALRRGSNAALCLGGAAASVRRIASLDRREALSASEGYAAAAARQATTAEGLWLFIPTLQALVPFVPLADVRLELVTAARALIVEADARWTGARAHLAALTPSPGLDLGAVMPGDAVLRLRSSGDPRAFAVVFDKLWPDIGLELRADGLELGADVLGQLEPGASVALSLNRSPWASELTAMDPRSQSLLKYLEPTFAGAVRDGADAGALLERVASAAPRFGVQVTREEARGGAVYRTTSLGGEAMGGALRGRLLLGGAPAKRLDELLLAAEREAVVMRADAPAVEATVDLARLRVIARGFGEEVSGIRRWVVRNTWQNWSGAIADLEAARLTVSATGDVVIGRAVVDVARAQARRPDAGVLR